jgi:predicted DNA-binding protein (MmcQ/YjbR family)
MSTLSLRLPNSLHDEVKFLAKNEGISINQFISSAVAEKMSALLTEQYLVKRAKKGNEQAFLNAMSKVSDSEPEEWDRLDRSMKEQLEEHLSSKNSAESSFPFGADVLVYKVMEKVFALVSKKETMPRVTLKCKPSDVETLVVRYSSISSGYYMSKKHWITIDLEGDVPKELVIQLSNRSYDLVVSKLTKSEKKKLLM